MKTSKIIQNRKAYRGVEAVVVDMRPNCRGNVVAVRRDGKWRWPRLPEGVSALPRFSPPRVRRS